MSIFIVMRRLCEAGLYDRIAVKKPLLRKQNNVKGFQWAKAHKDWTIEQWNKVLWTDKSKFKIFGSNRRIYVQRSVGKRVGNSLYHINNKAWRRLCVGFCQLQSHGFAPGEGQIESDRQLQHTAASYDSTRKAALGSRICTHVR